MLSKKLTQNQNQKWISKIPKPFWIVIISLLFLIFISLFINFPLGKTFSSISYSGFKGLEKTDEEYFLLVCNRADSQCQHIKDALMDLKTSKHNIYYFDTNYYIEQFSDSDEKMELINEYNAILEDMDVEQTPVIQRRKSGELINGIEGFYDNEYYSMLEKGEDINNKISELKEIYINFVQS